MNQKFVKLTLNNDKTVFLNCSCITGMERINENDTCVRMGGNEFYLVQETPEKILEMEKGVM